MKKSGVLLVGVFLLSNLYIQASLAQPPDKQVNQQTASGNQKNDKGLQNSRKAIKARQKRATMVKEAKTKGQAARNAAQSGNPPQ